MRLAWQLTEGEVQWRRSDAAGSRAVPGCGGSPGPAHEERRAMREAVEGEPQKGKKQVRGELTIDEDFARRGGLGQWLRSHFIGTGRSGHGPVGMTSAQLGAAPPWQPVASGRWPCQIAACLPRSAGCAAVAANGEATVGHWGLARRGAASAGFAQ
jgi:hypothetical protein